MTLYFIIAGIIVCVFFSNYFSASEMAYSSCNMVRLEKSRDAGSNRAGIAMKIVDRYDDALSAILIGNNLVNIAASSLSSVMVIMITGSDNHAWLSTLIITVLVIIFGETIPKICAKKSANKTAESHAVFINVLMIILKPMVWLVVKLIDLITCRMKGDDDDDQDEAVEELQSIIETAEDEAVLDEDRSELLQAAIDFAEISAFEVMTARVDVEAIDIDDDWEEIVETVENAPYSQSSSMSMASTSTLAVITSNAEISAKSMAA